MAMRAHSTDPPSPGTPTVVFSHVDVDLSTFPTSDGKPMAETYANQIQMIGLQYALRQLLEQQGRTRAVIGGNQFLYYNPDNRRENLSPDVYVALDVDPSGRDVWFTWEEGKAPDIVFEITSPSTQRKDLSREPRGKLSLYALLGVREYYMFDPQLVMWPHLRAFELRGEGDARRLEEVPLLPNGGVWSPLLGAELRAMFVSTTEWERAGTYLRVIDPATGAPIRVGEEIRREYHAAVAQASLLQDRLAEAEDRLTQEQEARRVAEERLAQLEAALRAPRADPARPQDEVGPGEG